MPNTICGPPPPLFHQIHYNSRHAKAIANAVHWPLHYVITIPYVWYALVKYLVNYLHCASRYKSG